MSSKPSTPGPASDRSLHLRCSITGLVAAGAAYASYRHGRDFALRFGADETTVTIWPLLVDGLRTMATVELWKTGNGHRDTGVRWTAWLSFLFWGNLVFLCQFDCRTGVEHSCRRSGRMPTVGIAAVGRDPSLGAQVPSQADGKRDRS